MKNYRLHRNVPGQMVLVIGKPLQLRLDKHGQILNVVRSEQMPFVQKVDGHSHVFIVLVDVKLSCALTGKLLLLSGTTKIKLNGNTNQHVLNLGMVVSWGMYM